MSHEHRASHERDDFLSWALWRLNLRWGGYRKVRAQVHKRVAKRLGELRLADLTAYRGYLEAHPEEWGVLDTLCRITISRFCRGKEVFRRLGSEILPELAVRVQDRGDEVLRCWSAGCASGEEPYSVRMVWELEVARWFPGIELRVVATDIDPVMLERARAGVYPKSSLRDVPPEWVQEAFEARGEEFALRKRFRGGVDFHLQDVRQETPEGSFDLVLCRNLAFTYFSRMVQEEVWARIQERLVAGGIVLVGEHEELPVSLLL